MGRFIGKQTIERIDLPLKAGVVGVQGQLACGDPATGLVVAAAPTAGLRKLGVFFEDCVGDGTTKVTIQLPREITVLTYQNSTTDPVQTFATAHVQDGSTVSSVETAPTVGFVWEATATQAVVQG